MLPQKLEARQSASTMFAIVVFLRTGFLAFRPKILSIMGYINIVFLCSISKKFDC